MTCENRPIKTLALRFHVWKQDILRKYFPDRQFVFAPMHLTAQDLKEKYADFLQPDRDVFVWSLTAPAGIATVIEQAGARLHILEDGFLRSNRPFASRSMPLSLAIDTRTAHFDAGRASDLEVLLETYPFNNEPTLLDRATSGMKALLESGVTKYNGGARMSADALYGEKTRKRVLVLGQVDGDASIRFGCPSGVTQTDLIHAAVAENPDCEVIFRPHPDIVNGVRPSAIDLESLSRVCRIVTTPASLSDAFKTIDKVYTLTSLGGFEAMIRGLPVTVFGYPFYAGWGLTDDRAGIDRRKRRLTIEQLFAGAYLLYPKYFDPATGAQSTFEETEKLLRDPPSEADHQTLPPAFARGRHGLAIRVIQPIVSAIATPDDGRYFARYPYDFFQERSSPLLRLLGRLLFLPPQR